MKIGIQVGARPKAVKKAHKAIIAIMQQKVDQATIQKALDAFTQAVQVNHTMVTSNSLVDQKKGE